MLPFELDGRQHPVVSVFALRIVEHLNVFEHVLSGIVPSGVGFPSDPLTFQQLEETLGDSVVMTIAATAHAGVQIVLLKEHLPLTTGELAALIRMDRDRVLRLSPPYRHQQGLQGQVRRHPGLHRPTDDTA